MRKPARFGIYEIYHEQMYFLAFAGGKRELGKADAKEYERAIILPPGEARQQELRRLGPAKDPNMVPISGAKLLELIKDASFTPFFDKFFNQTHVLQINDSIVFESIKQRNYELARGI